MIKYILLVLFIAFTAGAYIGKLDKEAMQTCQLKHSFETCQAAILR